jgi:hypothetical protein
MRARPSTIAALTVAVTAALTLAACKDHAPDSEPILRLALSITEVLDQHPTDCDALGDALRPALGQVDKALSLQLRRVGVSAHRLDDDTRQALEAFARKFAAASQRCRDARSFKEALAALEGQLDER